MTSQNEPLYAAPETIRKMFGLSPATIYRLIERGEITSAKIGKSRRILVASMHAYFERNRETKAA
ncbi:helix-turn-helix domain-containing protein [Brytella acorum]|uniref:Helix-turn-helix domain-containing protein n=1 Tax=Brytella acorum TaxID=2959299 RepID=A0AA35UJ15_9PROT|nr:helix-turn-helix domain-containing protein [Brytella acorum]MDF3625771.1 helix-turn-helix domain-containing protein [Brytella acorum]CAI9121209.1 helix-turn-helix domain-containing protein [Brytella acorum]